MSDKWKVKSPVKGPMSRVLLTSSALVALALVPFPHPARAVDFPSRRPSPDVFQLQPGERHELEVTYLGIPGLDVTLEIQSHQEMNGRKVYHAHGKVVASGFVNLFFRINDSVDSWFDYDGFFTHKFKLVQDESKIQRTAVETFAPGKGESVFTDQWKRPNQDPGSSEGKFQIPSFVQDSLSAVYYLRTLPLQEGAVFSVPVVSEGHVIQVQATVTGLRPITVNRARYEAYSIKLAKLEGGKVVPGPENVVYVSNDKNRTLLEFSVWSRFGHVAATLKKFVPGSAN